MSFTVQGKKNINLCFDDCILQLVRELKLKVISISFCSIIATVTVIVEVQFIRVTGINGLNCRLIQHNYTCTCI